MKELARITNWREAAIGRCRGGQAVRQLSIFSHSTTTTTNTARKFQTWFRSSRNHSEYPFCGSQRLLRARRIAPIVTVKPQIQASFSTRSAFAEEPMIHDVFESKTGTWQYVVADPATSRAVIIDPVLDYDPATQTIDTYSAESLLSLIHENKYQIDRILETHAHADHITSASYLQSRLARYSGRKPPICIGKRIGQVQKMFGQRYGVSEAELEGVFDELFDDDQTFDIGELTMTAIHLPGHTPDHLGYKIGGSIDPCDIILHLNS